MRLKRMILSVLFFAGFASLVYAADVAPVEFKYLGLSPDNKHIHYTVKINSDKPVTQVDIGVKYMDATGGTVGDTTIAWQNIVKGTQLPIEKGQTYDVQGVLLPGATKADTKLTNVHFKDGTHWMAPN